MSKIQEKSGNLLEFIGELKTRGFFEVSSRSERLYYHRHIPDVRFAIRQRVIRLERRRAVIGEQPWQLVESFFPHETSLALEAADAILGVSFSNLEGRWKVQKRILRPPVGASAITRVGVVSIALGICGIAGIIVWWGTRGAPTFEGVVFFGGLGLAFLVIGITILLISIAARVFACVFERASTTTEAKVLKRDVRSYPDGYGDTYYSYHVIIQFGTAENQVILDARVTKELYDRMFPGGSVAIRYADANPRIALLEGEFKDR